MSRAAATTAAYPWEQPLGARMVDTEEAAFRVWAPHADTVSLAVAGDVIELADAGFGVYETVAAAHAGDDYEFVVDGRRLPDPCSRWQPEGLRGPSRILAEPTGASAAGAPSFETPALRDLITYELHIGAFSAEGTFDGAIPHLDELAALGVNAIEIMPVGEFPGGAAGAMTASTSRPRNPLTEGQRPWRA